MSGKPVLPAVVDAVLDAGRAAIREASNPVRHVTTAVRATAFWTAVVVPLAYPLLLFDGTEYGLLVGLLGFHALALVVGHLHSRNERDAERPG